MRQRITTGLMLTALLAVLLWLPGWCMAAATLICVSFAVHEEMKALEHSGHNLVVWPTWAAMALSIPLTHLLGTKVMIPLVVAALLAMTVQVLFRKTPELPDLTMSALPLLTVALPGLSLVAISLLPDQKAVEVVLLCLTFAVPTTCDTLAFFVGSRIGGPKLCPTVSPHKTISGAIGGMVGALLAVLVVALIANAAVKPEVLPLLPTWYEYVLIGLVGGVAGQMGDLFASLVKRQCGIKDFSNLFPGHGGMLDRLDSIFFMALAMYCFRLLTT